MVPVDDWLKFFGMNSEPIREQDGRISIRSLQHGCHYKYGARGESIERGNLDRKYLIPALSYRLYYAHRFQYLIETYINACQYLLNP